MDPQEMEKALSLLRDLCKKNGTCNTCPLDVTCMMTLPHNWNVPKIISELKEGGVL